MPERRPLPALPTLKQQAKRGTTRKEPAIKAVRSGHDPKSAPGSTRIGVSDAVKRLVAAASGGDLKAMRELGSRFWSGRGVARWPALAAEYWTIAALAGDKPSAASLASHLADIGDNALGGSMLAALCLAKVHDRGLGVRTDKARMYAWLMWGERYCTRDDDADIRDELLDMRGFYGIMLPDADKDDALDLVNEWASNRQTVREPIRRHFPSRPRRPLNGSRAGAPA